MNLSTDQEELLSMMLTEISASMKDLTPWEKSFITDQLDRYEKYGSRMYLSPKQMNVVKRIYEKATENGRPVPRDDDKIPF